MAFNLRKPPKLSTKHEAYSYQLDAFQEVKDLSYAAVFHEQGLGKTKIAIDLLLFWLIEDIIDTVFIVTKKILVQNWCEELQHHSYIIPRVLDNDRQNNSTALNSPILVYVMNYEVISSNLELMRDFLDTCRVGIILDESQKIKNPKSTLTKCFHSLSEKFDRRIIMTGTPIANRPYDIWSQIKFLNNGTSLGHSFSDFKKKVELPKELQDSHGYEQKLSYIENKLRPFSVRKTKNSAGLELPNKTILSHFVELKPHQQLVYSSYRDKLSYEIRGIDGLKTDNAEDILKRLLRLVQCASNPVLVDKSYNELPAKYIQLEILLKSIDVKLKKIIIWTGFIENIQWLYNKLKKFFPRMVHGNMKISDRNNSIKQFKSNKKCRILLATPGAAKEGLTLTVANHAIFYDRSFSLDDYIQAQDRIHRISQTEDCFVHKLIAKDTIDEYVDELLNAKYQAAQLAQGDISVDKFDNSLNINLSEMLSNILTRNPLKEAR